MFERILKLIDRIGSLPKAVEDLTASIRQASEGKSHQGNLNEERPIQVRFPENIERQRQTETEEQIRIQWWIARGTWAAFIAAAVYAMISCAQWQEMQKQTFEANRAWVAIPVVYPGVNEETKAIQMDAHYMNIGHSPAKFMNWNSHIWTIERPSTNNWDDLQLPRNATCDGLLPDHKSGAVVFPSMPKDSIASTDTPYKQLRSHPPIFVTDDIRYARRFEIIEGCVAYETMSGVGKSAFCYVTEFSGMNDSKTAKQTQFACPSGNSAY